MYDTAKKSRAANKAKAERLANRSIERVDSSDWTPPPLLNADVKTGMRPVSKQALKRGGKVHGESSKPRADRVARKAGGRIGIEMANKNMKAANEEREGKKHDGALKRGGRTHKAEGGMTMEEMLAKNPAPKKKDDGFKMPNPVPVPPRRQEDEPKFKKDTDLNTQSYKKGGTAKLAKSAHARKARKEGGKVHSDAAEDKAMIKSMVKKSALRDAKCGGGRMKKADGGQADSRLNIVKPKAMEFGSNTVTPGLKKGGRAAKAFGGPMGMPQLPPQAMAGAMPSAMGTGVAPTMPNLPPQAAAAASNALASARPFRAAGGRTKSKGKGKTNINIVIAQHPKEEAPMGAPMGAPPMPPKGVPVQVPPPAAGAPMGGMPPMPPMPPAGAPAMPPMARKAGGRISKVAHSYKDMEAGAGSGEGRLQKTDIAKRAPHKAGGKVYRSYKDMDAGAGSGFGRLEKTEIEAKKSRKG